MSGSIKRGWIRAAVVSVLAASATGALGVSGSDTISTFAGTGVDIIPRDHLTLRIQPNEGITLALNAKRPGPGVRLGRVTMDFDYTEEFGSEISDAYELLLLEVMEGDHTLFIRQDGVERAWEILQPALDDPGPVVTYSQGSWGPSEADELIAPRTWHVSTDHLSVR